MEFFESLSTWLVEHTAIIVTVGAVLLEVLLRLWKSDKIRSLLSYAGRILVALGKLSFAISDILSKLVPDRRAGDAAPVNTPIK